MNIKDKVVYFILIVLIAGGVGLLKFDDNEYSNG